MSQQRFRKWSGVAATLICGAGISLWAWHGATRAAKAADPVAPPKPTTGADEQAIRATADDFVKAFDAADAKTVAAEWSTDAEYTDESGQEFQGRAAIEKMYADLFRDHPGATISIKIESIKFLGPDIAVEKGVAKAKLPKEGITTGARYTVTHARRDGKWVMVVGRDAPYVADSNEDYLKDLEWMIGQWKPDMKDAGKAGTGAGLELKGEWLAQGNFMKISYTLTTDGKAALSGVQIVGWDPRAGKIVSWHFAEDGGFGNSAWTKDGKKWVLEAHGTFRDGSESSAVNIITPVDANSFTWQSVRRTLDGVRLPDVGPVKIVRVAAAK